MPAPGDGARIYTVHCSGVVAAEIRRVHGHAWSQRRGRAVTHAFREIVRRLERAASQVGEPAYRLPGLRLQIRTCVVNPLVVHFAVSEEHPLVFIKAVRLLPPRRG